MTYIKVCFINNLRFSKELSVISPVTRYWQKVRKWPDFYRAPGNSKGWSKFLCSCLWLAAPRAVCSGPLLAASSRVADGTEGKEHLSPTVCHLLPLTFTPLRSPSHAEATHRARCPLLLLLLWGQHRGGSGRGDSCRQWLPAMKPHHDTSALSTGLPNAETLPKRVMNSVETNKLADSQLEILIFKQHLTIPGKRHTEMY